MTGAPLPIEQRLADPTTPFVERLRILCGYVENATDTTVKVGQDDATRDWFVNVGRSHYHGTSMEEAFEQAFQDFRNNPF